MKTEKIIEFYTEDPKISACIHYVNARANRMEEKYKKAKARADKAEAKLAEIKRLRKTTIGRCQNCGETMTLVDGELCAGCKEYQEGPHE